MEFIPLLIAFLLGLIVAFGIWCVFHEIWDDINRGEREIDNLRSRVYDLERAVEKRPA